MSDKKSLTASASTMLCNSVETMQDKEKSPEGLKSNHHLY